MAWLGGGGPLGKFDGHESSGLWNRPMAGKSIFHQQCRKRLGVQRYQALALSSARSEPVEGSRGFHQLGRNGSCRSNTFWCARRAPGSGMRPPCMTGGPRGIAPARRQWHPGAQQASARPARVYRAGHRPRAESGKRDRHQDQAVPMLCQRPFRPAMTCNGDDRPLRRDGTRPRGRQGAAWPPMRRACRAIWGCYRRACAGQRIRDSAPL